MNEEKLIWGAGFIDDDLVCEAIDYKPRRIRLAPWACAAAAAVVLVTAIAVIARQIGKPPVLPPDPADIGFSTGVSGDTNSSNNAPNTSSTSELPEYTATKTESSTGNSSATADTSKSSSSTNSTPSTVTTGSEPTVTPQPPLGDKKSYEDIFEGLILENPATYGPPLTCEEVTNMLKPKPDLPEYDLDSYYLVEVVRALTNEEYTQMRGEHKSDNGNTIYEAKLLEDLISGEKPDRVVYVEIPAGLGPSLQLRGDPTYASGEKLTAALTKPCGDWNDIYSTGYNFLTTVCDSTLRYDLPEMDFTSDDTETMLYYRGRGLARQPIADLPFDTEEISIEAAKSTPQNPATYIQKIALSDLVEFLREEWQQAGISSHFES